MDELKSFVLWSASFEKRPAQSFIFLKSCLFIGFFAVAEKQHSGGDNSALVIMFN